MFRFLKRDDRDNLDKALSKTRLSVLGQIGNLFKSSGLNEESLNDLEDILVASDLGLQTTEQIITLLRARAAATTNTDSGDKIAAPAGAQKEAPAGAPAGAPAPR